MSQRDLNRQQLIGRIGMEPEFRITQNGTAILNLRMVTNQSYKDKGGEWKEKATWHTVVIFGKMAESLSKYLNKGDRIFVEGPTDNSSYEDRDGNKRWKTQVIGQEVRFMGGKKNGQGAKQEDDSAPPPPAPTGGSRNTESFGDDDYGSVPGDDDIPF